MANFIGTANSDFLTGGAGNDWLSGGAGNDTLLGLAGNDSVQGGADADWLDGGAGTDTLSYAASTSGVSVNLFTGVGIGGEADGDVITGFEHVVGSVQNDLLTGDSAANRLDGGNGNDTLVGGAGQGNRI